MRLCLISVLCFGTAIAANAASRMAQVSRAIEQTKSRQVQPAQNPSRTNTKNSQGNSGRSEVIDVDRLNKLIRALDKTWVMPRAGAKEPVGSNFQYKKTCASIFKARHGACQQLGFGVMCFNYCFERGEKLSFRCQDASDAAYCRQSGTFETFLAKYRKDGYKAKAYVHQMLSRCYQTAICNTQSGILNSTIIDEEAEPVEKTTKANKLRLLTKKPFAGKSKTTTTEAPETPEDEQPVEVEEEATTPRRKVSDKKRASPRARSTTAAPRDVATTKSNIWDKFTVGQKAKPTPKYIPFWQRLLSTTTNSPAKNVVSEETKEVTEAPEEEKSAAVEDKGEEEKEEKEEETTPPEEDLVVTRQRAAKNQRESTTTLAQTTTTTTTTVQDAASVERIKHTFKPLPVTTPAPPGPELAFQKRADGSDEQGPGFWNRFQPNRWFQSIHYVTNTGR